MPRQVTQNHQVIKDWATQHKAIPELIIQRDVGNRVTGLRLDFPGTLDDKDLPENDQIEKLSWEEFFKQFENLSLAFEYETEGFSDPSLAYHFIKRGALEEEVE